MGPREIVIIALIAVLLFGAPKLPELARSLGKSMRILKDETRSLADDDKSVDNVRTDAEQAQQRGQAPIPDSTAERPHDDGRGTH